jgi:DNA-binding NtrC family response regulator
MNEPAAAAPCRLLVIDDEAIVGKRLKQIFNKAGFTVEAFTDPVAAMQAMTDSPFDIVITDLKMEPMDGMEVLKRAKTINPACRVIVITGYASIETAEMAKGQGVFSFLAKPFRLDELKQAISEALASIEKDRHNG